MTTRKTREAKPNAGNLTIWVEERGIASATPRRETIRYKTRESLVKCSAIFAGAIAAITAYATPSITIDKVVQRWPWNNKVDISYTVSDGQDVANQKYYRLVFKAVINGETNTIDGVSDVGASAATGSHTVTWNAPSVAASTSCEMFATIHPAEVPSGDDYLVVNLLDGTVAFEGMYSTLASSLERYQAAIYKTDKMVLRKIPAGGTYPAGFISGSTLAEWKTDRDFYVGIYMVTQGQYMNLGYASNPAVEQTDVAGNIAAYRPVYNIYFTAVRGPHDQTTSPLPRIATLSEGTFFQRLNFITGNRFAFDMPTEIMFEIAQRAGTRTKYFWGGTTNESYAVCSENSGGLPQPVGSRIPNEWGLYDMAGNLYEFVLDDSSVANLGDLPNPWEPAYLPNNPSARPLRLRGGGAYNETVGHDNFWSFARYSVWATAKGNVGFRATWIVH